MTLNVSAWMENTGLTDAEAVKLIDHWSTLYNVPHLSFSEPYSLYDHDFYNTAEKPYRYIFISEGTRYTLKDQDIANIQPGTFGSYVVGIESNVTYVDRDGKTKTVPIPASTTKATYPVK